MSRWGMRQLAQKVAPRSLPDPEGSKVDDPEIDDPKIEVSVVMPVGTIDLALASALGHLARQTTTLRWELIVALNTASPTDRTKLDALIADQPFAIRVVDASGVSSASFARNVGARAATTDKIAFCDGDDQAEPDWLENLIAALTPNTAVGGHLGEERLVVAGQENWRPPATPGTLPSFLGADYLVSANMAVWASNFEVVDGFDEDLIEGEDIDFSWKLLEAGVELRYEPSAVIHYRHRAGLKSLLEQHYLYGRGTAQVLARRSPPGSQSAGAARILRPNDPRIDQLGPVHVLRKAAVAAGRLRGLLDAHENSAGSVAVRNLVSIDRVRKSARDSEEATAA